MSGTVTVTWSEDPANPYRVRVAPDQGPATSTLLATGAETQRYAVRQADEHGLTLVYNLDVSGFPTNKGNPETSRVAQDPRRICAKCRRMRRVGEYRSLMHRNRTTGREVFFGYAARCQECEARHGQ